GKVRQLEQLHPQLVERSLPGTSATLAIHAEQLDLLSVVKASQTISGIMVRDQLSRTLLRIVLEKSGARRAHLILLSDEGEPLPAGEMTVVTETSVEQSEVRSNLVSGSTSQVPRSILQYVRRTQQRVLLDDAAADAGRFSGDEYLAHVRPRSVLCL